MSRWRTLAMQATFLAFVAMLGRGIFLVARDVVRVEQSRTWPSVEGTIVRHADPDNRPASGYYRNDRIVAYAYRVDGVSYTGARIDYHRRSKWTQTDVRALLGPLLRARTIRVHYDPQQPEIAVLERGGSNVDNLVFLGVQLLVAAAVGWAGVRLRRFIFSVAPAK